MQRYSTDEIRRLLEAIEEAEAIVVGAGSGLSTAAGLTYGGERFKRYFADFIEAHGFTDMYSAGFYPFETPEERWAYWSRHIWYNRYVDAPKDTYEKLLKLLEGKCYFVLTTNVDHRFRLAGFPKERLFYTQGDYGLWQCSVPCHAQSYDNYQIAERMMEEQRGMRVPSELVPHCPKCGAEMSMNLRTDDTFVEDAGWFEAARRYRDFAKACNQGKVLHLELGVGMNTPVIIKYPFWQSTLANPKATYACINNGEGHAPTQIKDRSIVLNADIDAVLSEFLVMAGRKEA